MGTTLEFYDIMQKNSTHKFWPYLLNISKAIEYILIKCWRTLINYPLCRITSSFNEFTAIRQFCDRRSARCAGSWRSLPGVHQRSGPIPHIWHHQQHVLWHSQSNNSTQQQQEYRAVTSRLPYSLGGKNRYHHHSFYGKMENNLWCNR